MAQHYLAKCSFQYDTTAPRDALIINPCFRINGVVDAQSLADNVRDALYSFTVFQGPMTVKVYDLEGTKPVYPAGTSVKNPAATPPAYTMPRELAVCLSFYGQRNIPRERGRLYLPAAWLTTPANLLLRPSSTIRTTVGTLATALSGVGGANVDWIVWSRKAMKATQVNNWWVDDEWDIVRRRGLRGSTRTVGAVTG
jgi:hypothetical protein